jgi:hypothetical protein
VFAGGANGEEDEATDEGHGIHMPDPSYFPIFAAVGLPAMAYGVIYHPILIAVGALITVLGLFGWVLEPPAEEA